ncbi:MAG: queuosine precursor transporter [Candidatus Lambdaproteobacteria bacterium]|nr:queuosine precursor transporter [Candidatus Lambdaproteobacteria bacterium]
MTKDREFSALLYLGAAFVAALVTANLISGKIVAVGGVFVPAGILAYSITFAMTDTICEVWGRKRTQAVVNAGFIVLLLAWITVALAIRLPSAPFWQGQAAYAAVLGTANRIILASLIAYAVSQTLDVWLYHRLKLATASRMLWLRNNVSTLIAQSVDTVIFVSIAFYGDLPLLPIMLGQLTVKYVIALLDTPVVYGLVFLVRLRLDDGRAVNAA